MPTFLTTLTEILLYVAPGMLVVYAMSPISKPLQDLIRDSHWSPSAFALLFVWMVVGGVLARGCGVILIKWLSKQSATADGQNPTGIIPMATYQAVFRQNAEKIRYYVSIQHSMEAFAATFVALVFFGMVRLAYWYFCFIVDAITDCCFRSSNSEIALAMLLGLLCVPMYFATKIALVAFVRRGKAFEEIVKEDKEQQKQ